MLRIFSITNIVIGSMAQDQLQGDRNNELSPLLGEFIPLYLKIRI